MGSALFEVVLELQIFGKLFILILLLLSEFLPEDWRVKVAEDEEDTRSCWEVWTMGSCLISQRSTYYKLYEIIR